MRLGPAFAVLLALMLAFTSLTLAAARAHFPSAGVIEICAGQGLQVIPVDSRGNPVGPPHVCPDGVASFVNILTVPPEPPLRRLADGERLHLPAGRGVARAAPPRPAARAPPAPVRSLS